MKCQEHRNEDFKEKLSLKSCTIYFHESKDTLEKYNILVGKALISIDLGYMKDEFCCNSIKKDLELITVLSFVAEETVL